MLTGVCIKDGERCETFFEETEVSFWPLEEKEISAYIATGEPFDKAGSYGIQACIPYEPALSNGSPVAM